MFAFHSINTALKQTEDSMRLSDVCWLLRCWFVFSLTHTNTQRLFLPGKQSRKPNFKSGCYKSLDINSFSFTIFTVNEALKSKYKCMDRQHIWLAEHPLSHRTCMHNTNAHYFKSNESTVILTQFLYILHTLKNVIYFYII